MSAQLQPAVTGTEGELRAELEYELLVAAPPDARADKPRNAIKRLSWWHEAVIEWMLLNPDRTLGECAAEFRVSQVWLSQVINSDLFKMRLEVKREEYFGGVVAPLRERLESLAHQSIDVLTKRLRESADTISVKQATDTTMAALSRLGFGDKPAGPTLNVQINAVDSQTLQEARDLMRRVNGGEDGRVLDAPTS